MTAPRVFVSYVHESGQHRNDVLAFASFLRSQGVDAVLDVWSADVRHDWYAWALREMTAAEYVIVVASPTYRVVGDGDGPAERHRGVRSEAALLRELVYGDRDTWTPKVLPVLLPGHGIEEIPRFLSPYSASRFEVTACTVTGAEDLLRVIHRSPGHVPPPVLPPPELRPRPVAEAVVWRAGMPGGLDRGPDAVEVHLVRGEQADPLSDEEMRRAVSAQAARIGGGGPDVVRLDPSGAVAWVEENGSGYAVLRTGQRSAWFTPPAGMDRNQLVSTVRDRLTLLTAIGSAHVTSWLPAIGAGPARVVLPRLAHDELRPAELAARLVDDVLADLRPVPEPENRVTNTVTGNVNGIVIQAGDIHGGVHF